MGHVELAGSRRSLIQMSTLSVLGSACDWGNMFRQANAAEGPQWGYGYQNGPHTWSGTCASGSKQSPINLVPNDLFDTLQEEKTKLPMKIDYRVENDATIFNSGHGTMQVNFPPGQICSIGKKKLELLQFHFHSPSEHSVNGVRAPMEAHLVHKDQKTGKLVVLGVLMSRSKESNPILQIALDCAPLTGPQTPIPVDASIDLRQLLPPLKYGKYRPTVYYTGSLTTPPCTEGVNWFVFLDPIPITTEQIVDFEAFLASGMSYGQNSRPRQDAKSRKLELLSL